MKKQLKKVLYQKHKRRKMKKEEHITYERNWRFKIFFNLQNINPHPNYKVLNLEILKQTVDQFKLYKQNCYKKNKSIVL